MMATLVAVSCSDDDVAPASNGGASGSSGRAGSGGRTGAAGDSGSAGEQELAGAGGSAGDAAGASGEGGAGGEFILLGESGPTDESATTNNFKHPTGAAAAGKDIFRFETFGNEGFWTSVLQLPQGMVEKGVTPIQALQAGLSVDIDAIPAGATKTELAKEIAGGDFSPAAAPALNDPATTVALIELNAILGVSARNVKTINGTLDINATDVYAGESVGITCALCHSVTDASVFAMPNGGTIGKRVDGPTNHFLNVGAAVALAKNSRAFYPTLALDLVANEHMSATRKGVGPANGLISAAATEAEVDAYLTDPVLYPVGMFDDAIDGNGAPMHITPFFRSDLAAPWGSEGSITMLQNFNNLVYTALLDPTGITTAGGRKFLLERGGAAGTEIADNYEKILAEIGVPKYAGTSATANTANGYPFVAREGRTGVTVGLEAGAKVEESFIGVQVSFAKAKDLNAYLDSLPSPVGDKGNPAAIAAGRNVFRQQCTSCHNDDQSKFVPQNIVAFNSSVEFFSSAPARQGLFPGYVGALGPNGGARPGLAPVRNAPGTFDDKLIIVEASNRNQPRGAALPLLMDLKRKPKFLHDDSVASLDALLDPTRTAIAPHPFFIADATDRANVVQFLNSLDDQPLD